MQDLKTLQKTFSEMKAKLQDETASNDEEVVKEMGPADFIAYGEDQIAKAVEEQEAGKEEAAKARLAALREETEKVASFEFTEGEKAKVSMFRDSAQRATTESTKKPAGQPMKPSPSFKALTDGLGDMKKMLAALLDEKGGTADSDDEKSETADADDVAWPADLAKSRGDEVVDWGSDPWGGEKPSASDDSKQPTA